MQAMGVCFFKATLDPLSNISAMDHLKLVSDNQVPTSSYLESMVKDKPPGTQEERNHLVDVFLEKESECSSYLPSRKGSHVDTESRRSYLHSMIDSYAILTLESEHIPTRNSQLIQSVHSDDSDDDR